MEEEQKLEGQPKTNTITEKDKAVEAGKPELALEPNFQSKDTIEHDKKEGNNGNKGGDDKSS